VATLPEKLGTRPNVPQFFAESKKEVIQWADLAHSQEEIDGEEEG